MKTVDISQLKDLGGEGLGPWLMGDARILRTTWMSAPIRTPEQAQGVYDAYRAALVAGVRAPRPQEVVRVPDGYGMVVEYVPGLCLGAHVAFGTFPLAEAGREFGALAKRFHAAHTTGGLDWHVRFRGFARQLSAQLPAPAHARLVALVDAVPASRTLLHGDLHMSNVVLCNGELAVIDTESVGFGHPVFDLAIMRSRMFTGPRGEGEAVTWTSGDRQAVDLLWRETLAGYFPDAGDGEVEAIDHGIELLSQVDKAVHDYAIAEPGKGAGDNLTPEQQARFEACVRRIAELMFDVECLYF